MSDGKPQKASLSTSVGDYLKAIWVVAGEGPAATGDIARALGVTASSVTGMLGKLKRMGLIRYKPYYGAELTVQGRGEALRLIRRHRLLETFLIRDLGYSWDEVHEEAEKMEHVMSVHFTERLAAHLGQPSHDPHGDPIPRDDGSLPATPSTALCEAPVAASFTVARILSQDPEVLAYVTELGVRPGVVVRLEAREPMGEMVTVRLARRRLTISHDLACLILGAVAEG